MDLLLLQELLLTNSMTVFLDTDQNTLWDTAGVTLVFMVDLKLSQTADYVAVEV